MGQVYRARDTRLNRDVALKVLPETFANDPDRLARFTREAQTLAALNHPNIAHIYGLEESSGLRALVMELVEGDDLSHCIARGAIPLAEAFPIATQITEALEAAHEQSATSILGGHTWRPVSSRKPIRSSTGASDDAVSCSRTAATVTFPRFTTTRVVPGRG